MRPTPLEELEGIRRILADDVAPAVTAEYPRAQIDQVLLALERLSANWDRASANLAAESTSLEALLRDAANVLARDPAGSGLAERVIASLKQRQSAGTGQTFGGLNDRNRELRGLLGETIGALDGIDGDEPARLHDAIRTALRANLDRALAPRGG
jgi:hypothetical protein